MCSTAPLHMLSAVCCRWYACCMLHELTQQLPHRRHHTACPGAQARAVDALAVPLSLRRGRLAAARTCVRGTFFRARTSVRTTARPAGFTSEPCMHAYHGRVVDATAPLTQRGPADCSKERRAKAAAAAAGFTNSVMNRGSR